MSLLERWSIHIFSYSFHYIQLRAPDIRKLWKLERIRQLRWAGTQGPRNSLMARFSRFFFWIFFCGGVGVVYKPLTCSWKIQQHRNTNRHKWKKPQQKPILSCQMTQKQPSKTENIQTIATLLVKHHRKNYDPSGEPRLAHLPGCNKGCDNPLPQ